jgi:hypothetical protein
VKRRSFLLCPFHMVDRRKTFPEYISRWYACLWHVSCGIFYYDDVWYCLNQNGNWTTTPSVWSQEPLTDKYYTIYSGALPVGTWTIYFGVDLTQNGVLDDPLYYDYSTIVVQ